MFFRKITIFVVPDGTKKVKQFRIPKFFPPFFVLLVISFSALLFSIVQDYYNIKSRLPQISELKNENKQQRRQCAFLAQRINQITERMAELNDFDRKLKIMVNLYSKVVLSLATKLTKKVVQSQL